MFKLLITDQFCCGGSLSPGFGVSFSQVDILPNVCTDYFQFCFGCRVATFGDLDSGGFSSWSLPFILAKTLM